MRRFILSTAIAMSAACGGADASAPPHLDLPIPPTQTSADSAHGHREAAPASLASKPSPFPAVARTKVENLRVAVVEAHALPIVQLRVAIFTGEGYGAAGVAELTAEMLKEGGTRSMTSAQVATRVESLGATLSVDVDFDRTVLSLGVTKAHLDDALTILGQIVTEPRFDSTELRKLKARRTDEAREAARGSGAWCATRLLFRELYAEQNPYSRYSLVPSEIAKITEASLRDFHRKFFVPSNVELIATGDVTAADVEASTKKTLGAWAKSAAVAPKVEFPESIAPAKRRIVLASRAKSEQSDIFVVGLGPSRDGADWPDLRVANQILGGGVASRLFADVREQRSLAYSTRSQILELAHGKEPVFSYAGTATKKTGLAVQGLIENMEKISTGSIESAELASAGRYLSDIFAIRLENIGSIADMIAVEDTLGLRDGYWDAYRAAVREVTPERAAVAAKKLFGGTAQIIVVAGDASVIAKPLSHFGEVVIVDPEKEFATVSTLPADPTAALELP